MAGGWRGAAAADFIRHATLHPCRAGTGDIKAGAVVGNGGNMADDQGWGQHEYQPGPERERAGGPVDGQWQPRAGAAFALSPA